MSNDKYQMVRTVVSEARLTSYSCGGDLNSTILGRYVWNIALSESLYPALNGLEISLRNSVHRALTDLLGNANWFDHVLTGYGRGKLVSVRKRLAQSGIEPSADQIVANCDFGLWTHLFHRSYEGSIWPRLLRPIFPYAPRRRRTRNALYNALNDFRKLRNRISHYEPIWYWQDLPSRHEQILEVIGWISPEKQSLVRLIDRFPAVHSEGIERYRRLILGI